MDREKVAMPDTADDTRKYETSTQIQPRTMTPKTDSKPARPTNRANDTDRHVGARIRERRIMLGLSQQQMADLIGVTYQQAHKYERGINRISAGRLYEIAQVLGVPVSYFFEGLDSERSTDLTSRQRMCLELARNFSSISNEKHQEALSQLARALAADE
jgi:transcriptional regulator with XRE-family HTH domain